MAKCTGVLCRMQVGYKVDECDLKDCPCRTEPIANADRIRAMSNEEMAKILECAHGCPVTGDCKKMHGDCKACWVDWLQQPSE